MLCLGGLLKRTGSRWSCILPLDSQSLLLRELVNCVDGVIIVRGLLPGLVVSSVISEERFNFQTFFKARLAMA